MKATQAPAPAGEAPAPAGEVPAGEAPAPAKGRGALDVVLAPTTEEELGMGLLAVALF